ncbi:MAG: hypothetical protein GY832_23485 [Chloroflexi bacterium]|nr:hypothetical protein [Chloroflexota bacterium]
MKQRIIALFVMLASVTLMMLMPVGAQGPIDDAQRTITAATAIAQQRQWSAKATAQAVEWEAQSNATATAMALAVEVQTTQQSIQATAQAAEWQASQNATATSMAQEISAEATSQAHQMNLDVTRTIEAIYADSLRTAEAQTVLSTAEAHAFQLESGQKRTSAGLWLLALSGLAGLVILIFLMWVRARDMPPVSLKSPVMAPATATPAGSVTLDLVATVLDDGNGNGGDEKRTPDAASIRMVENPEISAKIEKFFYGGGESNDD